MNIYIGKFSTVESTQEWRHTQGVKGAWKNGLRTSMPGDEETLEKGTGDASVEGRVDPP